MDPPWCRSGETWVVRSSTEPTAVDRVDLDPLETLNVSVTVIQSPYRARRDTAVSRASMSRTGLLPFSFTPLLINGTR